MAVVRDSKQSVTITLRPKAVYTHCVAKCALPVCCVISEHCTWAINHHAIQKYCIHWLQAGYISGSPNVAYTAGHVARAAGGESNLYFTKTSVTFGVMEGGGKGRVGEKKSCELNGGWFSLFYSNSSSLWLINYPLIFHLMFILKFPFLKIL